MDLIYGILCLASSVKSVKVFFSFVLKKVVCCLRVSFILDPLFEGTFLQFITQFSSDTTQ